MDTAKNCSTKDKQGYVARAKRECGNKQANGIVFHFFGLNECESISSGDRVAYARIPTMRELAILSLGVQACIFRAKPVTLARSTKGTACDNFAEFMYGLKRLRKKTCIWAGSPKCIPQGLKAH